MSDILTEISDDLREQQLKAFWKEYGNWIIGSAIAAVILTGVLTAWESYKVKRNQAATTQMIEAIYKNDLEKLGSYASSASGSHAAIARLVEAGLKAQRGETEAAIALYKDIADTSGADSTLRDLATLLGLARRVDTETFADLEDDIDRLSGKDSPWRYLALEIKALSLAHDGRITEALAVAEGIANDNSAPITTRARAFTLRDLYISMDKDGKKRESGS